MSYLHTMGYYSAIKRSDVLIHATIDQLTNPENIMLNKHIQDFNLPLPSNKDTWEHIGPAWIIKDNLLVSKSLIQAYLHSLSFALFFLAM